MSNAYLETLVATQVQAYFLFPEKGVVSNEAQGWVMLGRVEIQLGNP